MQTKGNNITLVHIRNETKFGLIFVRYNNYELIVEPLLNFC